MMADSYMPKPGKRGALLETNSLGYLLYTRRTRCCATFYEC